MPSDTPPRDPTSPDPASPDSPQRDPTPSRKICEERARLLRRYADAAKLYADRVREMTDLIVAGADHGLHELRSECRSAWDETEQSRLTLYRHEADHQCDRGTRVPCVSDP